MTKPQLILTAGLLALAGFGRAARAQTLDPTFAPGSIYANGTVYSTLEQPDGKRVISGFYTRVNGTPASAISRFNTDGSLDAAFQQNVGAATAGYRTKLLSNGQFMMGYSSSQPFTVGGITRQTLLRLNADGTGDASFNGGPGPVIGGAVSYVDDFLPLANGQLLIGGGFDHFNGTAINSIARLTAAGTVDPTFNPGLGVDPITDDILSMALLPNGQILLGGYLNDYDGHPCNGLVRINADGSYDPTFVQALQTHSEVSNIVVQPDGKILLAGFLENGTSSGIGITRLLASGELDAGFSPPSDLVGATVDSYSDDALQLQPDGKIIYLTVNGAGSGVAYPSVGRLNANGTRDATFQVTGGANFGQPQSITLLASGKVLVGGTFVDFSGITDRSLIQLTSSGALDNSFQPKLQSTGSVAAMVRQPDGRLIAGGNFSEINGQPARRLARLNANGTLDTTTPLVGLTLPVFDLALQPDGRLLVATGTQVLRYLANGSVDNTFVTRSFSGSNLTHLLLQADGRVLVGGNLLYNSGVLIPACLTRLLADGTTDASFAPASTGTNRLAGVQAMAQQPNGKIVVAGRYAPTTGGIIRAVVRLESTGAVDASFTPLAITTLTANFGNALQVQADGKVLLGGAFSAIGGTARTNVARLNTDGTLDASFTPPALAGSVSTLLLQPNNRVLIGGAFSGPGLPNNLARLLSTGAADASFAATAVPNGSVRTLLIQPDGAIVAGGGFTALSGTAATALVRITAPNVLHVAAPAAVAERTAAWPVPAHGLLHVAPDPTAHAQSVELVDVLGRPVRHESVVASRPTTVSVETLPAGIYLLRVNYTEGTVTRRIQVQ